MAEVSGELRIPEDRDCEIYVLERKNKETRRARRAGVEITTLNDITQNATDELRGACRRPKWGPGPS
jgi:hypothetical protein